MPGDKSAGGNRQAVGLRHSASAQDPMSRPAVAVMHHPCAYLSEHCARGRSPGNHCDAHARVTPRFTRMPRYGTNLAVVGGDVTTDRLQPPDHAPHTAEPVFRARDHGMEEERFPHDHPLEYCSRVWEDFLTTLG